MVRWPWLNLDSCSMWVKVLLRLKSFMIVLFCWFLYFIMMLHNESIMTSSMHCYLYNFYLSCLFWTTFCFLFWKWQKMQLAWLLGNILSPPKGTIRHSEGRTQSAGMKPVVVLKKEFWELTLWSMLLFPVRFLHFLRHGVILAWLVSLCRTF